MSVTIQTPEELRTNVAAFKRMLGEKTVLHLIPEQGMTQEQLKQAVHNAAAFDIRMAAKYTRTRWSNGLQRSKHRRHVQVST